MIKNKKPRKPHEKTYQQSNKSKIKYYLENKDVVSHRQVIISGIRGDKSKYEIICDEGIQDLIKQLNKINCQTLWSCQGDSKTTPYIVISGSNLTKRKLLSASNIIHKYWKDYAYIYERITCNGDIAMYAYTKEQFISKIKKMKESLLDLK